MPGTPVQQYASSENNLNQEWAIYDQTGGSYTIQNVATGLMLDLSAGSASNGQPVIGYTANGTQAQRWLISPTLPPPTKVWMSGLKKTPMSFPMDPISLRATLGMVLYSMSLMHHRIMARTSNFSMPTSPLLKFGTSLMMKRAR